MAEIIYDDDYELCTISLPHFLIESLGDPISIPQSLRDSLDSSEPYELSKKLCQYFESVTDQEYEEVKRDNVYNYENDFDSFFVYSVFAPLGEKDWAWSESCFITIEIGGPGDPRCVSYSSALVYRVPSNLVESGFFSWNIGWMAYPISKRDSLENLEEINEKLSPGYSSSPTGEIRDLFLDSPIYSVMREGYVSRLINHPYPVVLTPYHFSQ